MTSQRHILLRKVTHNITILCYDRHPSNTATALLEACVEEVQGRGVLPASGWECAEPLEGVSGDGLDLLDEEAEPGEYGALTLELAVSRDAGPLRAAMEAAEGGGTLPEPEVYYYHSDHLGGASWITDAAGNPVQHLLYRPFGEPFVNQRVSDMSHVSMKCLSLLQVICRFLESNPMSPFMATTQYFFRTFAFCIAENPCYDLTHK